MAGDCVMGMSRSSVSGSDSVESAVTVLDRSPPASDAGRVGEGEQAQVQVSFRSNSLSSCVAPETYSGAASHIGSVTVMRVRLTLPSLVTSKESGTTCRAPVIWVVLEHSTT